MSPYERLKLRLQTDSPSPAAAEIYIRCHLASGAITREQARELLDMPLSGIACTSKGGST